MEIRIIKSNIIIVSDRLSTLLAKATGFDGKKEGKRAMGFAIFPCFIILRNLTHPMTDQWINHESIHVRQFIESQGVFWLISMAEYLYYRIVKKYSHLEAYRMESVEQEAYLNQQNEKYLSERHLWETVKYIKYKTLFHTDADYHVILDE